MTKYQFKLWVGIGLLSLSSGLATQGAMAADGACRGKITGAINLDFDCTAFAAFEVKNGQTGISLQGVNLPAGYERLHLASVFKGELGTGTYDKGNLENYGDILMIQQPSMQYFVNDSNQGSGAHAVVISAISEAGVSDKGKLYTIHGSFDATLTQMYPEGGSTVNVHIDF
ncbi:MAG: hypothetical protein HYX41_01890 [Bdellovibrio sp.]|nr:hypothetical protein [Bdellovibrio sp.]